jgi:3-mercaptopyruvate sulfurtransferase SseA
MRLISSFLAIAIVGIAVLTACNSAERGAAISSTPGSSATPEDGVRRITVPELKDLVAKNQAAIIDVRNLDAYNAGHIRGAKLMPVGEILNHVNELPKDKLIVTYCS